METPTITPGPWSISRDNGDAAEGARPSIIVETEEQHIALCFDDDMANVHLIAAAPDMLEALKTVRALQFDHSAAVRDHVAGKVEAAIGKAENASCVLES